MSSVCNQKGKSLIAFPDDYVVIDIETTGLELADSCIIEVAAIRYSCGIEKDRFDSLIKPPPYTTISSTGEIEVKYVPSFITELTGITDSMLKNAPPESEVIPHFINFIGNSVLVGHNVGFDVNFLRVAASKFGLEITNDYINTLRFARKLYPEMKHHRLSDIAEKLGLICPGHRALSDALTTAKCFSAMVYAIDHGQGRDSFISSFKKQITNYKDFISTLTPPEDIDETNPFYGKVVVFTGAMSSMTRKQALTIVSNLGGIPSDSVTVKTNFLVVGNEEFVSSVKNGKTSKMRKADALKAKGKEIETLSENTFLEMIES